MGRVAVLDRDHCHPDDCGQLCYRSCPMVRSKINAIEFREGLEKPFIVEALCTGCGICIRKCPFDAISIVNLPHELEGDCSFRYGENAFKLFRLPIPAPSTVTGLIGKNGIGKSTALKILSGELKPNLGNFAEPPEWPEIITTYRGSYLQSYFDRLRGGDLRVVHKPQYIERIPHLLKGSVKAALKKADERGALKDVAGALELTELLDRPIGVLSGGEAQRLAIAAAILKEAEVYIFDEPSSYLDAKQRINAAKAIRSLVGLGKTVLVAEHDIAMLDYLSDQVCVFYGEPGVYGIVSHPHGVRVGVNIYLDGHLPDDNMRFRDEPIKFNTKPLLTDTPSAGILFSWGGSRRSVGKFELEVEEGEVRRGEVLGLLGPNGIGKTTFLKTLVGLDGEGSNPLLPVEFSYKPQYISTEFEGSVEALLRSIALEDFDSSYYQSELLNPLRLERLLDRRLPELSGGELQKVAVAACLSRKVPLYLIDEPSAFLDIEERIAVARAIKKIAKGVGGAALVVEHDVVVQAFLAERLMIFTGTPGRGGYAHQPLTPREGMNLFLKDLQITFRRDPASGRPRVNKELSQLDRQQKEMGEYYYIAERVTS